MTMFEWLLGSPFVLWETLIESDTPWSFIANEFVCRFIYDIVYRLRLQSTWNDGVCGGVPVCVRVCVCVRLQPVTISQKENNQRVQIHAGGLVVRASASSTKGFACMWHWYHRRRPATYVHGNRARPKTRQAEFQRTSDRYGTHVWVVFLFFCTSILTCQPCSSTCWTCWTLRTQ